MKRSVLGSYLCSILLNPQLGEPGGAPPENRVRGTAPSDLDAGTINALAGDLGLDPSLFGQPVAPAAANTPGGQSAKPAAPTPTASQVQTPPAATAPPATPPAQPAATPAPATTPAELTAEQTAWLEQRAAATTPEAAAELDAKAPAFTDEQWTAAEAALAGQATPAAAAPDLQAQLTAAQTEAARIKAEADAQSKRLAEIEAENARLKTQPVAIAPMSPLMAATPEQLLQAERSAAQLKQWALANWDGSPEVPASGDQPAVPAYTAAQVRAAFARADDQLTRVIPAAREYQQQFEQENTLAKQVYPELFDTQSPHCQTRENILRRLPGLRAGLPQIATVIGDAIVGEVVRGLMATETRTAEAKALAEALVKAAPQLAKLMPGLATPAKGAARQLKLTAKPVVPLARPSGAGARTVPRPNGKTTAAPNLAALAKAAGTENENAVLLELVRSQLPGIPTIDPKLEA